MRLWDFVRERLFPEKFDDHEPWNYNPEVEMGLFPAQRSEAMAESNKPVDKVRIGNVSATIWEQENGFYNATVERNYKDKNGKWQSTNSFSVDDLVVVAKVADKAADRMIVLREEQQQEYEEEQRMGQGR